MHLLLVLVEFGIVLGIMVLVHEFGHFAVAKLCGVRVETFSIGFGPRLFGWRRGDTDYRLSLLPLGGYVKMSGDVPGELPTGDPGEFNAHPRWQRVLIALAGPVANFVLSFVLLALCRHVPPRGRLSTSTVRRSSTTSRRARRRRRSGSLPATSSRGSHRTRTLHGNAF